MDVNVILNLLQDLSIICLGIGQILNTLAIRKLSSR